MRPDEPQPLTIDTARLLVVGVALWSIALVVSLLVPTLHQGDRQWWPWACLVGMVGGGLALLHIRRGRGRAEAPRPVPTREPG